MKKDELPQWYLDKYDKIDWQAVIAVTLIILIFVFIFVDAFWRIL